MGLVIDSSSPDASVVVGAAANACPAFVPPDDPLIMAMWAGDSTAGTSPPSPTCASTPSATWILDGWERKDSGFPTEDAQAAIFHSILAGTPGSTVVTVTSGVVITNNSGSILKAYVFTGHDPAAPIGATGGGRAGSVSSISVSYTATITGGQGFMVISDWNAGDTASWTAATGCTIEDKGTVTGEISYAVVRRTAADGVNTALTQLGVTGLPAGGQYHWVYAEVISLEAAIAAASAAGYAGSANPPMF